MKNVLFPILFLLLSLFAVSIISAAPKAAPFNKTSSVVEKKKEEKKSFFQKLFSKKKTNKKSKNKAALKEFLIIVLASLLVIAVGGLALYLAWFGMNFLALFVLILGAVGIVWGAIKIMKKIPNQRKTSNSNN